MRRPTKLIKTLLCIWLLSAMCVSLCSCGKTEATVSSIEELSGKTIAVLSGSTQTNLVAQDERLANCNVLYATTVDDGFALVESKKADAFFIDKVMAQSAIEAHENFLLLEEELGDAYCAAAFQKDNPLLDDFNYALAKIKRAGVIDDLQKKWFVGDVYATSVVTQDWAGNNGKLICITAPDSEPMSFKDSKGKVQGLEIDIALAVAKEMDYTVVFRTANFDNVIPSVMKGQADFAIASIDYTEERAKSVDFSDSYFDNTTMVVVRGEALEGEGLWFDFVHAIRDIFFKPGRGRLLLGGFAVTNVVYFATLSCAMVFGFGVFLLYYLDKKWLMKTIDFISSALQFMPASSWLLVCFYTVFAGNTHSGLPATIFALTFMFGFGAFRGIRGMVAEVDVGQIEAAYTMGYRRYQLLFKIIIPQAISGLQGLLIGLTADLVKATALVGSLYVIDVQAAFDQIRAKSYESVFTLFSAAIFYTLMNAVLIGILRRIKFGRISNQKSKEDILKKIEKEAKND